MTKKTINQLRIDNLKNAIEQLSPLYADTDGLKGKLTFAGVLREFIAEVDTNGNIIGIGRGWDRNADGTTTTAIDNIDHYNKRILPNLSDPYKALEDYTAEDFLHPIDAIVKEGYEKMGKEGYSTSTIDGYRRLVYRVYERALANGIIHRRVLEGTSLEELEISNEEIEQEKKKLRKSFTPLEEIAIFDKLLSSIRSKYIIATGQLFGLLLMCFLGLRPQEVASLTFGDLRTLKTIADRFSFEVVSSNKSRSRIRTGSGKTANSPRKLVVFSTLAELINDRETRIMQALVKNNVHVDISLIPIACKYNHYELACTPEDISAAGHDLLLSLDFPARRLAVIEEILRRDAYSGGSQFLNMGIEEKNPTTYLLRRNAATRLHLSGLTEAQIQYLIGHSIEQKYVKRSDFTNEDMLIEIIRKVERHPIYQFITDGEIKRSYPAFDSFKITEAPYQFTVLDSSYFKIVLPKSNRAKRVEIVIDEAEPNDSTKLVVLSSESVSGVITTTPLKKDYPQTLNNLHFLYRVYHKAYLTYRSLGKFYFR